MCGKSFSVVNATIKMMLSHHTKSDLLGGCVASVFDGSSQTRMRESSALGPDTYLIIVIVGYHCLMAFIVLVCRI